MKKIRGNEMKKQMSEKCSFIVLVTIAVVILFGLFSGFAVRPANAAIIQFYESQITSNSASQENPDIYGETIVYQDNRNGNWDIYMNNVWGSGETRITTDPANQINPRISGDKIVYQDDRNGNWDIYMYDLITHTETRITNNPFAQQYPAIDGNRIVWQDSRNTNWDQPSATWDIYMYDLSTQTETRVTTSGTNTQPAISGNRIAYIKSSEVYYFDLSTGNEVRLTAYYSNVNRNAGSIAICGSLIVWHEEYAWVHANLKNWQYDVSMRDVVGGATWSTNSTTINGFDSISEIRPAISELYTGVYYIVYQKVDIMWNYQIELYHTDWQTKYRVTTNGGANPRVSGGYIVYQDDRNGNWDIYVTMVGYVPGGPPGTQPTPAAAIEKIEAIEDIISDPDQIPTSDIDGARSKVKENRREALLNKLDAVIASIQAAADSTDPADRTANCQNAIDQLISILEKTDGCALRERPDTIGTDFTPDWIITCDSQAVIDPLFRSSIAILQQLLE